MRKNYKNNIEKGIKNITLLSSTIIIFTVATIIGTVLLKTQYDNFKNYINNFEKTLIEREMFYIKTSVQNHKNDILFEELSILNNKKSRVQNQSIVAYNLALSLYKRTKHLSKKVQLSFIISSLRQMSNKSNDINYFVLNIKGDLLLNTDNKKDENKNFYSFRDINEKQFIKEMILSPENKQNRVEYSWYKPSSSLISKKITYSRHLKQLGIIIGSGSFVSKKNTKLNINIINKITNQNFNMNDYLFILKINSLKNIIKDHTVLTKKNIDLKKDDLLAVKNILKETQYKANDYIFYNNKLIYATYISHLRYFIAVGISLNKIQEITKKEREIALNNMYARIINLIIIITIIAIIFFILSLLFTKKISKIFEDYKNNVILNEEKYHLLFNHSNDAFLISQLSENTAKIINFNKTALKVSLYNEKEILEKDFFDLFFELNLEKIIENNSISKTLKLKTKNNTIKTIELNAVIYVNVNDKLLFASLRDITERTLLREEKNRQEKILIQKSKMASMGEMIANIAHQWRQPLSQVSGLFLDIESAYDYKELNKEYLHKRVNEANNLIEYMSKTIDDFSNFFDPNAKKELFLINEAVMNSINIVISTLKFHNIKLNFYTKKEVSIRAYKNEYSQAILNIITNAKDILIERKIKNPEINISILDDKTLKIEDNAGGVDNQIIEKIFDPYFTTKFKYGTGIGLYMSKLIIENKLNGTIKVKNSEKGAVFYIKI